MDIEFNPDGSIKLPEAAESHRREFQEKLIAADKNPRVVISYREKSPNFQDEWTIKLPSPSLKQRLVKVKFWADKQHDVEPGKAWIKLTGPNEYTLTVSGNKNRCKWAHAFINGLQTAFVNDFSTRIKLESTCSCPFMLYEPRAGSQPITAPMKIYVAGPLRNPDYKQVWLNVQKAIEVGLELIKRGHTPYIPHLTYFMHLHPANNVTPGEELEFYMNLEREWLKHCDALFFIGPSEGANRELEMATKLGLKVFATIDEIPRA